MISYTFTEFHFDRMAAVSDSLARMLILAQTVKGAALSSVILRALRDPSLLMIAELLDVPAVEEV